MFSIQEADWDQVTGCGTGADGKKVGFYLMAIPGS